MKLVTVSSLAVLACALLAVTEGTPLASPAGTTRAGGYRLVLGSTRAGETRAYSMLPNGSRLTPVIRPSRALEPLDVSADGRTVAYRDHRYPNAIYVSSAAGTGLRRVARGNKKWSIDFAALSPDGKELAFTSDYPKRIFIVGADGRGLRNVATGYEPDWSPDGRALAFTGVVRKQAALVVQPLQGRRRVLARGDASSPTWSPNGRWISYGAIGSRSKTGLWVVRPNGEQRHRVARSQEDSVAQYAWSPDGQRLAFTTYAAAFVVRVNSRPRPLGASITPKPLLSRALVWSPDGRRLMLSAHEGDDPDQIWVVGSDGRGLRRLTSAGANNPLGWTRLRPVLPPAAPVPANERVLGPNTIATRSPIGLLSADGERVAFVSGTTATDCEHVDAWTPAKKSILRVSQPLPAPCSFRGSTGLVGYGVYELALAGSRVAWADIVGCGNFCDVAFSTATMPQPNTLVLDNQSGGGGAGGGDLWRFNAHGDGDLLVFNSDGVVRIDAQCGPAHRCKTLRSGAHTSPVESVSGHLIAVREPSAVAVLNDQGALVNVLPFGRDQVKAARLDGDRLVVARSGLLEVYDAATGAALLQRPLPAGYTLTDVDGGIAVLQHARTILALRLDDGRSFKLTPARGPVLADLEEMGLYYSYTTSKGEGRLVFVPRSELERQLETRANKASAAAVAAEADWLVLTSNRDGKMRPYSVDLEGSRLTPLFPPRGRLDPVATSRDGSTVVYSANADVVAAPIYVSRADGTGLRRVARKGASPALSPNGRLLAYTTNKGIWIVGIDGHGLRRLTSGGDQAFHWSPSGKALVYVRVIDANNDRFAVVVRPLRGKPRVLARTGPNDDAYPEEYQPDWSPDGRWISYINLENKERKNGLTLVQPNGKRRHRAVLGASEDDTYEWSPDGRWIAYLNAADLYSIRPNGNWRKISGDVAGAFEWSPNGRSFAFSIFAGDLVVARGDGRVVKRLQLGMSLDQWFVWSPDSSRIAFAGRTGHDPTQIWVVGSDGHGLRRLTNEGTNGLIGWTRLAPVLPPASPIPPTERVVGADSVATDTPVAALSADGPRVAFVPRATATDCIHVQVWTPGEDALRRLGNLPAPCGGGGLGSRVMPFALAGSRAAWVTSGDESGDTCQFELMSATLADPVARQASGTGSDVAEGALCKSTDIDHLRGDGDLLVFNDELLKGSPLLRIGAGGKKCRELLCTTLRNDAQAAPVASVSGGLIATRKQGAVAVLDEHGTLVRLFSFVPADVNAAFLDTGRLVVWRFGVLEVYDVATGARTLSQPLPPGYRLTDVDGGIAVLRRADTIMLLRLDDAHSVTLTPGQGPVLADLEPPGLYYSYRTGGGGRVVYVPRSDLLTQLATQS
jgi:Tol biopolymer transport system component